LAGESAADNIDGNKVGSSDIAHVLVAGGVGPVLREHGTTVLVLLDLPDHGTEASPLEAQLETAYSREKTSNRETHRRFLAIPSARLWQEAHNLR
jgi:hypothetical protein